MWTSIEEFSSYFIASARIRPWVIWAGSAISCSAPANLPLTQAIVSALIDYLADYDDSKSKLARLSTAKGDFRSRGTYDLLQKVRGVPTGASWRMPFEAIMGEMSNHTGEFVRELLTSLIPAGPDAQPNQNHRAIAELATAGLVDIVVTTNFDECLEPLWPGFVLVPTDGAFEAPSGARTLIKLHGTISDFQSVAVNPGALARRARPDWQGSVENLVRDRDVLFVGYGFQDRFDISPALAAIASGQAARFHWANKWDEDEDKEDLPIAGLALLDIDLGDPQQNVLVKLAHLDNSDQLTNFPSHGEQEARTSEVLRSDVPSPSLGERLRAFGSLHFWLEDGSKALGYFREECAGVDMHTLARALLRARRYRRAVSLFERMLVRELPADREDRTAAAVDWYCGAAHCAAAGGRPELAERFYRRATRDLRDDGKSEEDLTPYLMDQLLRGRGGNQVRLALLSWRSKERETRLDAAEQDLQMLLSHIEELELPVRNLVKRDLARIEIIRGNFEVAIDSLLEVKRFFEAWGDPDGLATTNRELAVARRRGRYSALARDAAEARKRGRWLEWLKIQSNRIGFTGYGPLAPVQWRIRNLTIATWDTLKEVGLRAAEMIQGAPPL